MPRHNHSLQDIEFMNNLIENMNELFYIYDTKGFVTFVNRKIIDMLGFHPEEVIGRHLSEFLPEKYRDQFSQDLLERIKIGERGFYVALAEHKDGSKRIMRHTASSIIKDGKKIGEMALAFDITEQLKAEKELKDYNQKLEALSQELMASNEQLMAIEEELRQQLDESEKNKDALADAHQRLEMLLDFLPDPTFAINTAGQVIIWNQAMEELTGLKHREMLGKDNYEYSIPFYGKRRPIIIDCVLNPELQAKNYYNNNIIFNNNTLYAENYCPQLGVNGTYLSTKSAPLVDRKGNIIGAIQTMQDISEKIMQEAVIRESEERYRNIIQNMEDGYFEVDFTGNFTFFNKYLHQVIGYPPNELLGASYRMVMDEDNSKKVMRTFNRVYKTGKPVKEFGWYVTRKDGSKLFVETTVLPIKDNDEITGFRGLIRDITERKKAEDALHRSEQNLKKQVNYLNTLINNLNEFFLTYDANGNISFANKMAREVLGYNPEELLGRKVVDLIAEDHKLLVVEAIQNRLTYGGDSTYELPIIHKSGKTRLIKLNASPIIDEKRNITGGMVLAEDITAKKMAEEQLKFSEARYRAIVEDQTELICRSMPDGTITFVNNAYCRYFDIEKHLAYGTNLYDIIYEEDRELVKECMQSLTPEYPAKTMELRVQMPNAGIRWINCTHRAIFNSHGILADYQSVATDITERKSAEEQLTYLSRHDVLTGLYNRFHFEEHMDYCENNKTVPLALIMCDVDGLKLVNDTLGHDEGDELLRASARVIKDAFRRNDIVARVGGDEFAVLLPDSEHQVAETAIKRIKDNIEAHNEKNNKVPLSISIGYAVRYDANISVLDLYQEADNNMYREKLQSSQGARSSIVQTLMSALEIKDFLTDGHGDRLQKLVELMGNSLNFTSKRIKNLKLLAQFHDIGKVAIPDAILFKSASLTEEEYNVMKRHSEIGHRIALSASELMLIADWILKHHEWWNGAGYPLGISGEVIPLECRIIAIADAYDAMTNDRPYRKAMSHEQAVKELIDGAGRQFDPQLVRKFITIVDSEEKL